MRRQRPLLHHRGFIFKTACFNTNQKMEVEKEIKLGTFGIIYGSAGGQQSSHFCQMYTVSNKNWFKTNQAMKRKELS